jgi:hypothetical protein
MKLILQRGCWWFLTLHNHRTHTPAIYITTNGARSKQTTYKLKHLTPHRLQLEGSRRFNN